jgi:hypothetical protein
MWRQQIILNVHRNYPTYDESLSSEIANNIVDLYDIVTSMILNLQFKNLSISYYQLTRYKYLCIH